MFSILKLILYHTYTFLNMHELSHMYLWVCMYVYKYICMYVCMNLFLFFEGGLLYLECCCYSSLTIWGVSSKIIGLVVCVLGNLNICIWHFLSQCQLVKDILLGAVVVVIYKRIKWNKIYQLKCHLVFNTTYFLNPLR